MTPLLLSIVTLSIQFSAGIQHLPANPQLQLRCNIFDWVLLIDEMVVHYLIVDIRLWYLCLVFRIIASHLKFLFQT